MDNQPNFFTGMARIIGTCLWVKGMEVLTEKKESEPKALEVAKFLAAYKMISALPWIAGLPRKEDKKWNLFGIFYFILYPNQATDYDCRIHLVSHLFIFLWTPFEFVIFDF